MKISELKTATCAVELPRPYTREEAIALAESWGLKMAPVERCFGAPFGSVNLIDLRRGMYAFFRALSTEWHSNPIKLSDIEP